MRILTITALLGVLACILWCVVALSLGRVARPDAGWAVAGLTLVFAPLSVAACCLARRFWKREGRLAGIAWLLAAATPAVWCGCHYAHLIVTAEARESLFITPVNRIAVTAALPFLDLEARLRYRRQTHGRHVTLFDNETATDPERLVLEMDRHLEGMAGLLGQKLPPACRVGWVRGPLVGMTGRAIISWGMANEEDDGSGKLTYLDRHEMAHVLITVLAGPEQDPPFALVEGWAQYQSADRSEMIRKLYERLQNDSVYTLQELVTDEWYGRSFGPAYWEGGPLTHYLIERFGPKKFFEFYSQTRRATFHEDARRLLGESWETTEEKFWTWVRVNAPKPMGKSSDDTSSEGDKTLDPLDISLAEGVDREAWRELVEALREAHRGFDSPPTSMTWEAVTRYEGTGDYQGERGGRIRAVSDAEGVWLHQRFVNGEAQACVQTQDLNADLYVRMNGAIEGLVGDKAKPLVNARSQYLFQNYAQSVPDFPWPEPGVGGEAWRVTKDQGWRINRLERPSAESGGLWGVEYTEPPRGDAPATVNWQQIDPSLGWSVVRETRKQNGKLLIESERHLRRIGDRWLLTKMLTRATFDNGTYDAETTIRSLGEEEAAQLRREVETLARQGPTPKFRTARRVIRFTAVGVPLLAFLSALAARRVRTPAPA